MQQVICPTFLGSGPKHTFSIDFHQLGCQIRGRTSQPQRPDEDVSCIQFVTDIGWARNLPKVHSGGVA